MSGWFRRSVSGADGRLRLELRASLGGDESDEALPIALKGAIGHRV